MNNYRVYIRYIKSGFDYCGGHKHIYLLIDKSVHYVLKLPLIHFAVSKFYPCIGNYRTKLRSYILYRVDSVIDIVNLSATIYFPVNCLLNKLYIILHNICLNRHSVYRCFLQEAYIPESHHTHMKSSRYRSSSKCKHIYAYLHLFNLLLMLHSESLLLIYDKQSEVFKFHILR